MTNLIFSESGLIWELNNRAEDSYINNPASTIYFSNQSIDINSQKLQEQEYIRSYYLLALGYRSIGDSYMEYQSIEIAINCIVEDNFVYNDNNLYVFYINTLYENKKYADLKSFLGNKLVIATLNEAALIEFNIMKIKLEIELNKNLLNELIDQSIILSNKLNLYNLESELNLIKANFIANDNVKNAIKLYKRVIELAVPEYKSQALMKLSVINNNYRLEEEAFLLSESLDDYKLTINILNSLSTLYSKRKDYEKLYLTMERINYYNNKHLNFLLKQQTDLYNFGYERKKLQEELDHTTALKSLYFLIIISMGAVLVVLIIFLSIQSYRLKGFNI